MAHIKCRYSIPYCDLKQERVNHDFTWFCDADDSECIGHYTRPEDADEHLVNPKCKYCTYLHYEFEKTVKQYEYVELWTDHYYELRIGKNVYTKYEIEYLEIDGRVLVGDEQKEGE